MTIDERLQFLLQSTESLHSTVQELTGNMQEVTGGLQALSVSADRHDKQIAELIRVAEIDGENIRGLANIAERHQQRLDALDGGGKE